MSEEPLYALSRVSRSFTEGGQRVNALQEVSLTLEPGKMVALCGPSGAGKSTLLHILGLLDTGYQGKLQFLGQDLSQVSARELTAYRLERIGFVFQRHYLVDAMTVLENVAWPHWRRYKNHTKAFARALELLEELGLAARAKHHPIKLSGGELQRVALARAMINGPSVLLADEPTAQLDPANATHIIDCFRALCRKGHSVLTVTHDPQLARAAHRLLYLSHGRIDERGVGSGLGADAREPIPVLGPGGEA